MSSVGSFKPLILCTIELTLIHFQIYFYLVGQSNIKQCELDWLVMRFHLLLQLKFSHLVEIFKPVSCLSAKILSFKPITEKQVIKTD